MQFHEKPLIFYHLLILYFRKFKLQFDRTFELDQYFRFGGKIDLEELKL